MRNIKLLVIGTLLIFIGLHKAAAQGNTCPGTPFCTTGAGYSFTYPNVHNGSSGTGAASWGCLGSEPDPSWFYIKTTAAGVMTYTISQSTGCGTSGSLIDVDFIAWGPYTTAQFPNACNNLTGSCSADHNCSGNIEDCSYSTAGVETMTLNSPGAGYYYIIMITNYAESAGCITFSQGSGPGSDCSITCNPTSLTMTAQDTTNYFNGTSTYISSGATVSCTTPFFVWPNEPAFTTPSTDIWTPCLMADFNPFNTNENTNGTVTVYEGGTPTYSLCNGCAQGTIGGGVGTTGNDYNLYFEFADTTQAHVVSFCKSGTVGTTTVSLRNCWDGTVYAGPTVWNTSSASCFSLTIPANTNLGSAVYSISPAGGASGMDDYHDGFAYIDPNAMAAGTYTLTYTFHGRDGCAPGIGKFVFTVPAKPTVSVTPTSTTICSGGTVSLGASGATTYTWSPGGATGSSHNVSPTSTSVYTVTGSTSGCKGTATATVSVTPPPTLTLSASSYTICGGGSQGLSVSGATTYTWSPASTLDNANIANPTASPTTTTVYTVSGTTPGCSASSPVTVTVAVNPPPTLTLSANSYTICGGGSQGLSASGATTYTWSPASTLDNANIANPTASPTTTTVYTVSGTTSGCSASSPATVTVTVAPPPSLTLTSNSYTVCDGSSQGLSATGASTYTWTPSASLDNPNISNPTASPTTTTVYTVTGGSPGCVDSSPLTVTVTVNPLPSISIIATNSAVCSGSTNTLTASGADTYTWSAGASPTTGSVVTVSPTINTDYTVTGTDVNSCVNSATITAAVNPLPTPPTLSGNLAQPVPVCQGDSVALTVSVSGSPTPTPVWYDSNGNYLDTGLTYMVPGTLVAGTYTYSVLDSLLTTGCTSSSAGTAQTVTVVVNSLPTPPTLSGNLSQPVPVCQGDSVLLTVSVNGSPIPTSVWYDSNGNYLDTGLTYTVPPTLTAGTYTYSVLDSLSTTGCTSSSTGTAQTVTVVVNPLPSPPSLSNGTTSPDSVCAGNSLTLNAAASGSPAPVIVWYDSTQAIVGTGPSYNVPSTLAPGHYVYYILDTVTSTGCKSSTLAGALTDTVLVFPSPAPPVLSGGTTPLDSVCSGNSINLNVSVSGTPTPIAVWYDGSTGMMVGTGTTLNVPGTLPSGQYTFIVIDSVSGTGCKSSTIGTATTVVTLNVNDTPTPPVLSNGNLDTSVCQNNTLNINATVSGSPTVIPVWYDNSGNIVSTSNPFNPNTSTVGTYTYMVLDSNTYNGCKSGTMGSAQNFTVIVNGLPQVDMSAAGQDSALCGQPTGGVHGINSSSISGGTQPYHYQWYGSGVPLPNDTDLVLTNAPAGTYSLEVTDANGCTNVGNASSNINVLGSSPVTALAGADSLYGHNPLTVNYNSVGSVGASYYNWTFGDGNSSTIANPTNVFASAGTYTTVLTAYNSQYTCPDYDTLIIVVDQSFSLTIPNIFSPNGDNINDVFYIKNTGVKDLTCDIFNRWGQRVYTLVSYNQGWDGKLSNGEQATEGTYFYILKLTTTEGKEMQQQGSVTLVR